MAELQKTKKLKGSKLRKEKPNKQPCVLNTNSTPLLSNITSCPITLDCSVVRKELIQTTVVKGSLSEGTAEPNVNILPPDHVQNISDYCDKDGLYSKQLTVCLSENRISNDATHNAENVSEKETKDTTYVYSENGAYAGLVQDLNDCLNILPSAPPLADFSSLHVATTSQCVVRKQTTAKAEGPVLSDLIDGLEVLCDVSQNLFICSISAYKNEEQTALAQLQQVWHISHKPVEHPLYILLDEYRQARCNNREWEQDLKQFGDSLQPLQLSLWTVWPSVELIERAKCNDKNDVILKHTHMKARLNKDVLSTLQLTIANCKQRAFKQFWPNSARIHLLRHKIENHIYEIQHYFLSVSKSTGDSYWEECLARLSSALDVLFHFVRGIPCEEDEELAEELRDWVCALARAVVVADSWQIRLHFAWHVLRSPPSAEWAAQQVYCPPSQPVHACALLALILNPVEERQTFFQERSGGRWILVDEDGNDSDVTVVTESVLLSLLSQVPLQGILATCIARPCNDTNFLHLLDYLTTLVIALESGLTTYGASQLHMRLTRRVAKIMRTLMDIATSQYELISYLSHSVQTSYDAFVVRCVTALLGLPCVWQFLAGANYSHISDPFRWKLYQIIVGVNKYGISYPTDLATRMGGLETPEQSHLMAAVTGLAHNGCAQLHQAILLQLFYAGFVVPSTRDTTYKDAKELLASLVADNVDLLSELLQVYENLLMSGELDMDSHQAELWQALAAATEWLPTPEDVGLLVQWLTRRRGDSTDSRLAKCILRRLDYTSMEWQLQRDIAIAVVHSAGSTASGAGDTLSSSSMWRLLCQLRLHIADREGVFDLSSVPDIDNEAELGVLVAQGNVGGIYLALQSTTLGHSVPLIYSEGFRLVRRLFSENCTEAAFACIDNLSYLFWDCPQSLVSCQDFMILLGEILVADESYLKMAKKLMVGLQVGPILQKFAAMFHSHLGRAAFNDLSKAVEMWITVFTSIPLWQHCASALYLIDIVCRRAFGNPAAWTQVFSSLEAVLPSCSTPSSALSPITNILRLRVSSSLPSLLPSRSHGSVAWFEFAAISVEFEVYEKRTSLWNELLRELWSDKSKKVSIDNSLKKVCNSLKLPVRTSAHIAIYRWAAQALEMPDSHPLHILVWGKLFGLYLARVPGIIDRGSPGACFFSGVTNNALKKRLKERLNSLAYAQPLLCATFQTLSIWLEDTRLLTEQLMIAALPVQYNAPLLAALLTGEEHTWFALLPLCRMTDEDTQDATAWPFTLSRQVSSRRTISTHNKLTLPAARSEKLVNDLGSVEPPPVARVLEPLLSSVEFPVNGKNPIENCLEQLSVFLDNYQKVDAIMKQLESSLLRNAGLMYASQEREAKLSQPCPGVFKKDGYGIQKCSGPATMILKYEEWRAVLDVQAVFQKTLETLRGELMHWDVHCADWWALACLVYLENAVEKSHNQNSQMAIFVKLLALWRKAQPLCSTVASSLQLNLMKLGSVCMTSKQSAVLSTILATPDADFLHELLQPECCCCEEWFQLYTKTVDDSTPLSSLLTRFNVGKWLQSQPPPSNNLQSQLLKTILSRVVQKDQESSPITHKTLNDHLGVIVRYNFPKHLGELLVELTVHRHKITQSTWLAVIDAVSYPLPALPLEYLHDDSALLSFIGDFAIQQSLFTVDVLSTSLTFLANTWKSQRQEGCSVFSEYLVQEPVLTFTGMLTHAAVRSLPTEDAWQLLDDVMSPWLTPHRPPKAVEHVMPFSAQQASSATLAATIFVEAVRNLEKRESCMSTILSCVLQWYSKRVVVEKIDGFVLSVLHSSLQTLPWQRLMPSITDAEVILQLINGCANLCNGFLGNVFLSIDWDETVRQSLVTYGTEINARLHMCLLFLLVKLSLDTTRRSSKAVVELLEKSVTWAWHLLDVAGLAPSVLCFAASCDNDAVLEYYKTDPSCRDAKVLRLVQVAAGFSTEVLHVHASSCAKRQLYLQTLLKCGATAASKRSQSVPSQSILKFISNILTDIEKLLSANAERETRVAESNVLVIEVLRLLTEHRLAADVEEGIIRWLGEKAGGCVTAALLQCAGSQLDNPVHYSTICEAAIAAYFTLSENNEWRVVVNVLGAYANGTVPVQQILISNGCLLTLHAISLQQVTQNCQPTATRQVLTSLLQMLATIKPNECLEPKLVLVSGMCVMLALQQPDVTALLKTLSDHVTTLSADRSSGFLTTLGLRKSQNPSISMKLCFMALSAGLSKLGEASTLNSTSMAALERAEADKQFSAVMGQLLTLRQHISSLTSHSQLVLALYSVAAQLYNKSYFVF